MKPGLIILSLMVGLCARVMAGPESTNSPSPCVKQVLLVDRASTPVAGGKATLSLSPLRPTQNVYAGDYHMKVSPYFFKSEKGKLTIAVPEDSLAKVAKGMPAEV